MAFGFCLDSTTAALAGHQVAFTITICRAACLLADPYVGGLAEPPEGGAHMGPLFTASIKEQFGRLRDADWWYYENGAKNKLYTEAEIAEIRSTSEWILGLLQRWGAASVSVAVTAKTTCKVSGGKPLP